MHVAMPVGFAYHQMYFTSRLKTLTPPRLFLTLVINKKQRMAFMRLTSWSTCLRWNGGCGALLGSQLLFMTLNDSSLLTKSWQKLFLLYNDLDSSISNKHNPTRCIKKLPRQIWTMTFLQKEEPCEYSNIRKIFSTFLNWNSFDGRFEKLEDIQRLKLRGFISY